MASKNDRIRALLALELIKPDTLSPCPSVMDIAYFCDGVLDNAERGAIMLHLVYCDSCRREWLAIND